MRQSRQLAQIRRQRERYRLRRRRLRRINRITHEPVARVLSLPPQNGKQDSVRIIRWRKRAERGGTRGSPGGSPVKKIVYRAVPICATIFFRGREFKSRRPDHFKMLMTPSILRRSVSFESTRERAGSPYPLGTMKWLALQNTAGGSFSIGELKKDRKTAKGKLAVLSELARDSPDSVWPIGRL